MNLSISNIAWTPANDDIIYALIQEFGFKGLEIAPTRLFPDAPYENLSKARIWSEHMQAYHGISIPSMQSIWYGRTEQLFGTYKERQILIDYTKKSIDFASAIRCRNLVFGCPKNRSLPEGADPDTAIEFFREIGDYAKSQGTVVGIEANPPVYQTNYINDTFSALDLVKKVDSEGFRLNLDVGTMIQNDEKVHDLVGQVPYISHVHISEPLLKPIEKRELHRELYDLLSGENYQGFVSIEMGKTEDIAGLRYIIQYVYEVFGK